MFPNRRVENVTIGCGSSKTVSVVSMVLSACNGKRNRARVQSPLNGANVQLNMETNAIFNFIFGSFVL